MKSRKSCYTTLGVGVGVGVGVSKKFNIKVFLCDGQGAVRRAILSLWQVLLYLEKSRLQNVCSLYKPSFKQQDRADSFS